MAFADVIKSIYPNVPAAAGVPPLLRGFQVFQQGVLLTASALTVLNMFQGPRWGVFSATGAPLLIGDSVVGMAFKKDYRVADYPMEQGAFASHNKVELPYDARLSFTVGGSDAARSIFLDRVARLADSLQLVSVVMPEFTFLRANLVRFDFERRSRSGVTMLQVDVMLQEVRVASTTTFTQTRDPSGASMQNGGVVQPTAPTPLQASASEAAA
jgi:hypothetical protein